MALHHKAGTVACHSVVMHASFKKHNPQKHLTLLVYQHALQNALHPAQHDTAPQMQFAHECCLFESACSTCMHF